MSTSEILTDGLILCAGPNNRDGTEAVLDSRNLCPVKMTIGELPLPW